MVRFIDKVYKINTAFIIFLNKKLVIKAVFIFIKK